MSDWQGLSQWSKSGEYPVFGLDRTLPANRMVRRTKPSRWRRLRAELCYLLDSLSALIWPGDG